jgi:hypothetical protein
MHGYCLAVWAAMTNIIRHPDGSIGICTDSEQATKTQRIIDARHQFNVAYCTSRGWPTDPAELTIAQIMEIRERDGWKNAGRE